MNFIYLQIIIAMMDNNNTDQKKMIEKSVIYNSTIERLSSILQEEMSIKAMLPYLNINHLLINKNIDNQPIFTIVNTELKLIHQHCHLISWQIGSIELLYSFELTFLLKTNTLENSTLITVFFSIKGTNTLSNSSDEDNSKLLNSIFTQVNKLIEEDNFYRSQMETIVIEVPKHIVWDHVIKWEYASKDKVNCSGVTFDNDPNAKGTEISFLDKNKKLLKYKVTVSDKTTQDYQWFYFLELIQDFQSNYQQVKFIFTSIEPNKTYLSMENFFDHNVTGEMLEKMKIYKKHLLEEMKRSLESKYNFK